MRVIKTLSFIALTLCITYLLCGCGNKTTPAAVDGELPYQGIAATIRTDSITELLVEFEDVCYGATATQTIRLHNNGDVPLSLLSYKSTCRCTWVELPNKAIAPGDFGELELLFDSRGEYGSVGNYVDIATSDSRSRIGIWMSAKVKR